MENASFTHELILLVIDKLALGLIFLVAGFFVNLALEYYRSNQAIREGVEKERIAVIAPLWKELNALHFLATHKYNIFGPGASEAELTEMKKEMEDKATSAILYARTNRFCVFIIALPFASISLSLRFLNSYWKSLIP